MLPRKPILFRDFVLRFGFSLFMVASATYLRVLLSPTIHDRLPFGTYTVAVIAVAWIAGVWPAVLALVSSTLCAAHFIVPPENSLAIAAPADVYGLIVFSTVGTISIVLFSRIESQRRQTLNQSEKILQLNSELTQRDRQKNDFLALLAHELRSPLAPIGNAVALLERDKHLHDETRHFVGLLNKNYRHLVRLVDDLLDVSRYIRGTIELKREQTELIECIELAIEMNREELNRKQHELITELPDTPILVDVDAVRICQVVCNLLSNAIKYTPERGRISISVTSRDDSVVIQVQDNGLGIPESMKEQIFTPFFQAHGKQSRFAPGLGLGLAIVRKLVEQHGGSVEVQSRGLNNGSRFVVTLPSDIVKQRSVASFCPPTGQWKVTKSTPPHRSIGQPPQPSQTHPRVLVVDDDHDTADTLKMLLQMEQLDVQVARNGQEALRLATTFQPRVVLLDIGLPELDGYEVAQRLRQYEPLQRTFIVAVSGWGSEADKAKGRLAGFDAHLVKPVRPNELIELIQTHSICS